MSARAGTIDLSFPHDWHAEILRERPLIAPARHLFYPANVEEVELGALEILFRPKSGAAPAMATFALGFADPSLPHGLWSCPNSREICTVAGGYAYIVNTAQPDQWTQIPYRPVASVHVVPEARLLLFAGFHRLMAWSLEGQIWETEPLSHEGLQIAGVERTYLTGFGWDVATNADVPFTIDLSTGRRAHPNRTEKETA